MQKNIGYGYSKAIITTFVFFMIILCVNIGLTQYFANKMEYHTILGKSLIGKIYYPWEWIVWSFNFFNYSPKLFAKMYLIAGLLLTFPLIVYVIVITSYFKKNDNKDLHGSAHWATYNDIEKAGLCQGFGVYTGGAYEIDKYSSIYLRDNGPANVLSVAPTRSGKGVGQVLPTLLSWEESVVVNDIKGENYALTAGYQKALGKKVLKFDPGNPDGTSVKFNPLDAIRIGTDREVGDAQTICTMIVDDDGQAFQGENAHWNSAALSLLIGIVLHILYVGKEKGITTSPAVILTTINNPEKPVIDVLNEIMIYPHKDNKPHPTIAQSMREILNKADKERDSVISTAVTKLGLYKDPVVANNTSYSEFFIEDLMDFEQPIALYLCSPPAELAKFRPLLRLMIELIVSRNTEVMKFENGRSIGTHKYRLLMMLDEFAAMGKMNIIEVAMAFTAGYGIKFFLILQSYTQLFKIYSENQSITSNCHTTALYPTNDVKGAELISKICGVTTVLDTNISYSGKNIGFLDSKNVSTQKVQRPLMTVDEVMQMRGPEKDLKGNIIRGGEMLVVTAGNPVARCTQVLYFQEEIFLQRAKIPAPEKSDTLYPPPKLSNKNKDELLKLETKTDILT